MADQDNPGAVDQNLPAVIQGDFNLDECDIFSDVIALIPYEVAERHKIIPISRQGSIINIAMADSSNVYALDDVKFLTGLTAEAVPTSLDQIERALVKYYSDEESREAHRRALEELDSPEEDSSVVCEPPSANLGSLVSSTDDAPVVRLVNMILVDAVRRGATTIHLETYANDFRVRYRMEDRMFEIMRPPLRYKDSMLARLKVMANFNMKGRGLPQKGVIKLVIGREKNVSFNVSTMPTAHGEKMVIQ
ncbi:MAG: ATPase, T2SS/T4P/T4SS family, partial [Candidatus Magasanikbacteria bacterium]|nr:ATPase, T2SS/T4P/T4SS family [Candidatus Magasanikbacteria bacterium]